MEDIPTVFNPRLNDTREILSTRFGGSSLEESVARGNKSLISTATAFSGSAVVTHLSTSTPWSLDVSVDEYLEERNRSFAQSVFPALVVLVMLMVLGIAGNTLVLYVYTFRMKGGTITRFVQALAVFDLVSCCVAIPGRNVVQNFEKLLVLWKSVYEICTRFYPFFFFLHLLKLFKIIFNLLKII